MKTLSNHPLSETLKGGELFMKVSLDRFSVIGPNEYGIDYMRETEEEDVITCSGCNFEIDETESFITEENPIAGKDYIHNLDECIQLYKKDRKKDLIGEIKSLVKGNMA